MELTTYIEKCEEENRSLLMKFNRGMLTVKELENARNSVFTKTLSEIKKNGCSLSCEDTFVLCRACGLKPVAREYKNIRLGFDCLDNGGLYIFKDLSDVEALKDVQPGHSCTVTIGLPKGSNKVRISLKIKIFKAAFIDSPTDIWYGWKEYEIFGKFTGYNGEGKLYFKEETEESVLYLKCYQDLNDPIWNEFEEETTIGYIYVNADMEE